MRKVLYNSPFTRRRLEKMRKVYLIGCWAHCGIREYPWSGKFEENPHTHELEPLVWEYVDLNGALDEFHLMRLSSTTTGTYYGFSFSKARAELMAKALENANF